MKTIIAIDLGTTLIKTTLLDEDGNILKSNSREYPLINKSENEIEQDPFLLWEIVTSMLQSLIRTSGIDTNCVKAIGLSSQGISIIPVDTDYTPLYNMISWLDGRASYEINVIKTEFCEEELYSLTGKRLNTFYSLPKILWIKNNKPDIYKEIHKILLPMDYIFFKLTGRAITDHTMAGGTMIYNVRSRGWSNEIANRLDIAASIFPEIQDAGRFFLYLSEEVANYLGLPKEVKVVLGAQDQKCAAIGAGIDEESAVISMGTCSAILVKTCQPYFDKYMRIPVFSFLCKNSYLLEGVVSTTGVVFEWLRMIFHNKESFKKLTEYAEKSPPGSNKLFFYPHFEGAGTPHYRQDIRGFIYGLNLSTSKEDIIRSLLEGVAFQVRQNIAIMEEIMGSKVDNIKIIGGGAKSDLWCSIIADVLGKKVIRFESSEVASRGAAIMAGVGSGIFESFRDGYQRMKGTSKSFFPDKKRAGIYNQIYKEYMRIESTIICSS